jgi:hypothetical protein
MIPVKTIRNLSKLAYDMAVVNKVSLKHISTLTLHELTVFLREQAMLQSTFQFLNQMIKSSIAWNASLTMTPNFCELNTRVFLVCFLATIHPNQVIEVMNEHAVALIDSSKNLSRQFNRITNILLLNPNHSSVTKAFKAKKLKKLSKEFLEAIIDYLPKFLTWKSIDEIRMKDIIWSKFWALFKAKIIYTRDNERFNLQDPVIVRADQLLNNLRMRLRAVCGHNALHELDTQVAQELRHRRSVFLLCQEHARKYGPNSREVPLFDFIS